VVVVKPLYVTFLIHKEQLAFQAYALRITIKLAFGEFWAGCSFMKSACFHELRHKADIVDPASKRYQDRVCACGYRKRGK